MYHLHSNRKKKWNYTEKQHFLLAQWIFASRYCLILLDTACSIELSRDSKAEEINKEDHEETMY